jgi:hypothetical protein
VCLAGAAKRVGHGAWQSPEEEVGCPPANGRHRPGSSLNALKIGEHPQDGVTTVHGIYGERIPEEDCRDREDRLLRECFAVAGAGYWLDDADRARLRLAGLGDIERLFEWAGDERRRFEEARADGVIGMRALLERRPA